MVATATVAASDSGAGRYATVTVNSGRG